MKNATLLASALLLVVLLPVSSFAQCDPGWATFTVELEADENFLVDSTRWQLTDGSGHVLLATNVDTSFCIPADDCYTFTITDNFGNGLAAEEPGYYSLWFDENLIATGVDFGYSQTASFGDGCVPGSSCFSPIVVQVDEEHTVSGGERWYAFTPTEQALYEFNTCGFGNSCNTAIWVYDRCLGLSGTESQEETILYNDDACDGNQARVVGVLYPNETYYIRVGDTDDDCADTDFQWRILSNGPLSGCTDPLACNYDPLATVDDGTCLYNPDSDCPLGPDLTVTPGHLSSSLRAANVNGSECYVNEGCLQGYGQRQVVRFTTYIANIGTEDYVIGSPDPDSGQFEFDECHGHWHQEGYAEYRLYRDDGTALPVGFKNGFCVLDLDCSAGGSPTYGCGYMGISAGCADIYGSGLACQWVDVTDLPDGNYTLVVVVNWDRDPDIFGREEVTYENNWDQVCFELSRDASGDHEVTVIGACPVYEDCAGVPQGDAQPDCRGDCDGDIQHGDLNANGIYDYGDISLYLNGILDNSLPVFECTEITGDNLISLEDPIWVNDCILLENNPDGHTTHAHSCQLPTIGIYNPGQSAEFTITSHNTEEQYVTVALRNPGVEMVATHFRLSGMVASDVQLVTPDDNWDARTFFRPDGQVVLFSYGFDSPTRFSTFMPLVRVYYSEITENDICLDEVYTTVNRELERVNSFISPFSCISNVLPCSDDEFVDSDGDGICDADDLCPGFDDNIDTDENGIPDGCDLCVGDQDSDGDGICDANDICIGVDDALFCEEVRLIIMVDNYPTETSIIVTNLSGEVVWEIDGFNGDDIGNEREFTNCLPSGTYDFTIYDSYGDGICCEFGEGYYEFAFVEGGVVIQEGGEFQASESMLFDIDVDVPDADQDGVCDQADACPGFDDNLDADADGMPDGCDTCPNSATGDSDGDGVCDDEDLCPGFDDNIDTDEDGIPDGCDTCPDAGNNDSDGDGVCDDQDICPGFDDNVDSDNDGVPDGCDDSCAPPGSMSIVMTPAPVDNQYVAGQVVEMCVTINIWQGNAAGTIEWLHGLTFDFGPGWDYSSVVPVAPASCDGEGYWDWYESWISCNTGITFGPGFAFESGYGVGCGGTAFDGNPGNNWGDGSGGCSSIPQTSPPVTFCLDITVGDCTPEVLMTDLGVEVRVWSDGESGSWTQVGCNSGQSISFDAMGACCGDITADADMDGIPDDCDDCPNSATGDSDGDGVCDDLDICPGFDDAQDADGDGEPDACDTCPNSATGDSDGDGVCDDEDICPDGDDTADADNDGEPDACDTCPNSATGDSDGDGVCDDIDLCPGSDDTIDTDADGTPDACDTCPNSATGDSDGDGVCDDEDICPGSDDTIDTDADGTPDACDTCPNSATGDSDGDGVCDDEDICPDGDDTADADNDGEPDACDTCPNSATGDSDGDGVCDDEDLCPGSDDTVDTDADGTPDACDTCPNSATGDSDGDGVCDDEDICPGGDDTMDSDGDGTPNACDDCPSSSADDSDGDGVCDDIDICPGSDDTIDTDADGTPDGCDACPNSATGDSDGDGVCDDIDICPGSDDTIDTDADGTPDGCDSCPTSATGDSDGDGVCDDEDICPGSDDTIDTDADGTPDGCDACPNSATGDSDSDGVCDDEDLCPGSDDTIDTDADGTPDGCDACPNSATGDSDGDGVCDDEDLCPGSDDTIDTDADGTPDGCDACPTSATGDSDGDGVCDDEDLCPGSDDTIDTDADGTPDGCDACPTSATGDSDGDGVCDDEDLCPGSDDTIDTDADGTPDGCDACPTSATGDSDGDGVCDDEDICPGSDDTIDTDADGTPDGCDACPNSATGDSDGDGVCDDEDLCPGSDDTIDTDADGTPDGCDACPNSATGDSDGDGVCDDEDLCPGSDDTIDTDADGTPDGCDLCPGEDDNDDLDGDGIPDRCDDTIDDQDQTGTAVPLIINGLYPNPTTGILHLGFNREATVILQIFDVYGREVRRYEMNDQMRTELHLDQLVDGTYQLLITSADQTVLTKRFVKVKG